MELVVGEDGVLLPVLEDVVLIGSSVAPLLELEDELRVLVEVPVAIMVLVKYVVPSSVELDRGV